MLCIELIQEMSAHYLWHHLLIDDMLNVWFSFMYMNFYLCKIRGVSIPQRFGLYMSQFSIFNQPFFFVCLGFFYFLCLFFKVYLCFVYFDPN